MTMKKTSSRIAIFSDLHLGVHCNSSLWHSISIEWAKWFAADLKSKNITDIIFCGDFFHDRESVAVSTIHVAGEILNILSDFNLHMFAGNHDCFFKMKAEINSLSILGGRSNVFIYNKPTKIGIGDELIATLCPWGTTVEQIDECDIVFGHFEVQTFKMNTFKLCEHGLSIRQILMRSPIIFSGHFHFRDERFFETGSITYVGNPFQTDMNDSGNQKGYYIFDADKKSSSFIPNTISPLIFKLKLSQLCGDVDIRTIHNIIKGNIITIVFDEYIDDEDVKIKDLGNKHIFIDPGKKSLFTMMDETGRLLKYTNAEHLSKTKRKQLFNKIKAYKDKHKITDLENELTNYNSKSCKSDGFKEYIKHKLKVNDKLMVMYYDVIFRKIKWYSYINTKRAEDAMVKKIENYYGKDRTIIIGDWCVKKQLRNFISTPNVSLKRKLNKKFKIFNIDEFRTSCLHYKTEERCNNLKIDGKKMHSILTFKMEKNRIGCINRDRNGCLNIKKLFDCYVQTGKRPLRYTRGFKI